MGGWYVWYQLPGSNRMINMYEIEVYDARYAGAAEANAYAPMYTEHNGHCVDLNGADVNSGTVTLDDGNSNWDEQRCLMECQGAAAGNPVTGCEYATTSN